MVRFACWREITGQIAGPPEEGGVSYFIWRTEAESLTEVLVLVLIIWAGWVLAVGVPLSRGFIYLTHLESRGRSVPVGRNAFPTPWSFGSDLKKGDPGQR